MKKTIPFTVDQTVHVNKTTSADTKLEENIQKRPPGGKGPRLGEKDDNEVIKGKEAVLASGKLCIHERRPTYPRQYEVRVGPESL